MVGKLPAEAERPVPLREIRGRAGFVTRSEEGLQHQNVQEVNWFTLGVRYLFSKLALGSILLNEA